MDNGILWSTSIDSHFFFPVETQKEGEICDKIYESYVLIFKMNFLKHFKLVIDNLNYEEAIVASKEVHECKSITATSDLIDVMGLFYL